MRIQNLNKNVLLGLSIAHNVLAKPSNTISIPDDVSTLVKQTNTTVNFLKENMSIVDLSQKRFLDTSKHLEKSNWPDRVYAPYVYLYSNNRLILDQVFNQTNNLHYILSFMGSKNGIPAIDGKLPYTIDIYDEEILKIRKNGGDVIMSFGGAGIRELATDIFDITKLQEAYQSVIDRFNLTWIDMDIEGYTLLDHAVNNRRNQALVALQKANPHLKLSYCLLGGPNGLLDNEILLLKDAVKQGVRIDVVNVMTMNYDQGLVEHGDTKMGEYIIETTKGAKRQLEELGLLNTTIGITPMIGINDEPGEIFNLADAKKILDFAKETDWVTLVSIWSLNRDNGNCANKTIVDGSCSGLLQKDFEFSNTFKNFTGSPFVHKNDTPDNLHQQKHLNYALYSGLGVGLIWISSLSLVYLYYKKANKTDATAKIENELKSYNECFEVD